MNIQNKIIGSVACALSLFGTATASYAGSTAQPGISTGFVTAALPPVGLYNIVDINWGARGPYNGGPEVDLGVAIPVHLVWSTPYELLGGRLFFVDENVWAQVAVGNGFGTTAANLRGFALTKLGAGLSWDLGAGFHAAIEEQVFVPVNTQVSVNDYWEFSQKVALGYTANEWLLNAELVYGTGNNGRLQNVSPANAAFGQPATAGAAWGNLNLTALREFGKWEVGAIGYGSTDLSSPYSGYLRQSQFALGGAVAYKFDQVKVVVKVSRDVYQSNEGGYDTRAWGELVFPLWKPEAVTAVAAKY